LTVNAALAASWPCQNLNLVDDEATHRPPMRSLGVMPADIIGSTTFGALPTSVGFRYWYLADVAQYSLDVGFQA
jgi:hypothetical protein